MDTQFATPDAGNLPSGERTYYVEVEYSAMKTPENFVKDVNEAKVADSRANFKLGFHYYDKSETVKARVAIQKFSFVVLEVLSSVGGYREVQSGQQGIKFISNQVRNSKEEPFAVFQAGIKRPVATGYYQGKKDDNDFAKLVKYPDTEANRILNAQAGNFVKIPDGAGFNQHFICWWIEGQMIVDLKLSTMVSREIKNAITEAENKAGRKVKPERVKTYALAQGTAFWGFAVTSFKRVTKDGTPYDKKGEMFLVPSFACGVVKNEGQGANPDLYATCLEHQTRIRQDYEAEVLRRAKFGVENVAVDASPMQANYTPPTNEANFPTSEPTSNTKAIDFDKRIQQPAPPVQTVPPVDDLPF